MLESCGAATLRLAGAHARLLASHASPPLLLPSPCAFPSLTCRQGDGSSATAQYVDAEWTPLLNTPSHPEYPSGHSATAGASAKVLEVLLGDEPFTIGTEFPDLEPRDYASIQEVSAGARACA